MSDERAFDASIEPGPGGGAFVVVPFGVEQAFGSRQPKVKATFDGHPYRGSIAVREGRSLLLVRKAVREAIAKDVGDEVRVVISPDREPRTVEVPSDLASALENAGQRARFDDLAYTHRKEYVAWVEEAKRDETRERRVRATVEGVAEGKTRS